MICGHTPHLWIDVELICVHFCFSDLDIVYIKTTGLMSRFQIWPSVSHTMTHMHIMNVYICDVYIHFSCDVLDYNSLEPKAN